MLYIHWYKYKYISIYIYIHIGINIDGQGGLVCCDSWGRKESDTTE